MGMLRSIASTVPICEEPKSSAIWSLKSLPHQALKRSFQRRRPDRRLVNMIAESAVLWACNHFDRSGENAG
ncbi:hypothetical protein X738_28070 [Mesorhizobium sp. LNHC209A00]|nr:hypothetical protein X738_28070 [Mesorhizobium sp. LNHC209A00]